MLAFNRYHPLQNGMEKTAVAKWKEMISGLGHNNKVEVLSRGLREGWIPNMQQYVKGLNTGTDNMLRRLGYSEVNVDRASKKQLAQIRDDAKKRLQEAIARGDKFAIQREQGVIRAASGNGENRLSQGRGYDNTFMSASTNPEIKAVHTGNMRTGLSEAELERFIGPDGASLIGRPGSLIGAITRRHELEEAAAAEKALRKNFNAGKPVEEKINAKALAEKQKDVSDARLPKMLHQTFPHIRKGIIENMRNAWSQDPNATNVLRRNIIFGNSTPGALKKVGPGGENIVGGHFDIDVLSKEREMLDKVPFQISNDVRLTRLKRRQTGESNYIEGAGGYDNSSATTGFSRKNIKNVKRYDGPPIELGNGVTIELAR